MCAMLKGCCSVTIDSIRAETALIIQRDNAFLVAAVLGVPRWSSSPYDAWKTRKREAAERVAKAVDGNILLFNPIIGKIKEVTK